MADRNQRFQRDSFYNENDNCIPTGRQINRTPLADVAKQLDLDCEDAVDQDDDIQNKTFDCSTPKIKTEPDCPNSMLRGMKGYQLTPQDLEFIHQMKEEKLRNKLQGDREEGQRLLKKELMELACAARDNAQAELEKYPSCEELSGWIKLVRSTSPSTELDAKSLLAMVTEENVQRIVNEKSVKLDGMRKRLANMRKRELKERRQLEKQIASEQLEIQKLTSLLSDMKSELAQEEESYKALEMQINSQEAPEIKAKEADPSEEPQATKSQARRRGRGGKEAVKAAEKLQDAKKTSKSTRNKLSDDQRGKKPTATVDAPSDGLRRSKRIASRK